MKIKKIAEEKFQPMSDEDRERLGLSKRDQSQFNAYMGIGIMMREIQQMTPEQRRDDWKKRVDNEINSKGFASVSSLFINHYNVGIRKGGDGKYEAFLTDVKGWQSPEDHPQYPDISKAKRDKPLARFPDLNNAYSWVQTQFLEQERKRDPDKFCPGCENPIGDDEVNDPQYEVTVVHGQRWHTSCWRENERENDLAYKLDAENDPQEELPSNREAQSLRQMKRQSGKAPDKKCPGCGKMGLQNGRCKTPGCNRWISGKPITSYEGSWADQEAKRKATKQAQIIPDDGLADGGARYTDEEMDLMEGKIQPTPEEQPKKWYVKVTFDDGEVMDANINGTQDEIRMYYLSNDFVLGDEKTMHRPINVEFIKESGDVPWTYWGESARPKTDKQSKSLWQFKKISP